MRWWNGFWRKSAANTFFPSPDGMRLYYRFLRLLARGIHVLYFRGRVYGLANVPTSGGVMLACNHQSYLDPVLVTLALDREGHFMARDTLFHQPSFRRLIESLNAFPVKRGAADVGAVKEILRRLKSDKVVVVFPEGTRTNDGRIGAINANSLLIAKRAGATIVPTVIDGAFDAWPRRRMLPAPSPIYVTYCKAITPAEIEAWSIEEIGAVVDQRLRDRFAASQELRRRRAGIDDGRANQGESLGAAATKSTGK